MIKPMQFGASALRRTVSLAASVPRLPTDMERGNAERAVPYSSARWRRRRRDFLHQHPVCCTADCRKRAIAVDHRDGHQRTDWRARFWDERTWQGMCGECHAVKKSRFELAAWRNAGEGHRDPVGGFGSPGSGARDRASRYSGKISPGNG
jgi:hypothetical protein